MPVNVTDAAKLCKDRWHRWPRFTREAKTVGWQVILFSVAQHDQCFSFESALEFLLKCFRKAPQVVGPPIEASSDIFSLVPVAND
jgi:hypothetical protein